MATKSPSTKSPKSTSPKSTSPESKSSKSSASEGSREDGLALAALILSLLFFLPPAPLVGLVLGIIVLATKRPGKNMAIAAIVINAVYLLLTVVAIVAFFLFFAVAMSQTGIHMDGGVRVTHEVFDASRCEDAGSPDKCYIDAAVTSQNHALCEEVNAEHRSECYRRVHDAMQQAVRTTDRRTTGPA